MICGEKLFEQLRVLTARARKSIKRNVTSYFRSPEKSVVCYKKYISQNNKVKLGVPEGEFGTVPIAGASVGVRVYK